MTLQNIYNLLAEGERVMIACKKSAIHCPGKVDESATRAAVLQSCIKQ